ncbi:unnamed protein product [Urochloa decumbens]|uniref:Uncharacterized protein n=1 Tax=Urochloa decumbens TaxID=240449 RepID=A0ABC9D3X1_9POAL
MEPATFRMLRSQLLRRLCRVAPLLESELDLWTGVDKPLFESELATFSRRMSSWTMGERPTQRSTNSSMVSCRPVPTSRSSDSSLTTNSLPSSRFRIRHLGSASSPSGVASEEPEDAWRERPPSGGLVGAAPSDLDREMGETGAGRTGPS